MNFCPSCGSPQGAGTNFCVGCGFKLDSTNVPSSSTSTSPDNEAPTGYDTRSIGQTMVDDAATYVENKTNPLRAYGDFDGQFTACMHAKGYKVPLGMLSKLEALMPLTQEKGLKMTRDMVITHYLKQYGPEFSADLLFPVFEAPLASAAEMLIPELKVPLAFATEVYDHAFFLHALADCALRAWPGGPADATLQALDTFPVPDVVPPPPIPVPIPVLPPPPENWSPAVIPMEDPTPVGPKPTKAASDPRQVILQILTAMGILILIYMVGLGVYGFATQGGGGGGSGGGTYYLHFNCQGDGGCSALLGSDVGIHSNFDSQSVCLYGQKPLNNYGANTWCDTNSDPSITGP